ncbi:hypothetical protein GCM10009789_05970 [Kribbella sancticallisti]|uniref:Uncharacterized protein n=1 Tax=Kribbella sancticallisti TaxID=460087 RepID=A0ABN2CCI0_9ACTN
MTARRPPRWCPASKSVSKSGPVSVPSKTKPQVICALTWGFVLSRLSESNRRPSHYESVALSPNYATTPDPEQ